MTRQSRRLAAAALQATVTVVLLVLIGRGFDWVTFRELYRGLPFWFYAASLVVVVTGILLYAWRWRLLLVASGIDITFRSAFHQYLVGVFVNNFLPSTIGGDAARVFYVGRDHGYRAVMATVILERLLGLGLLALLATIAAWAQPPFDPRYVTVRLTLTAITVIFAALVLAIGGTTGLTRRLTSVLPRMTIITTQLQQLRREIAGPLIMPRVWMYSAATVGVYFLLLTATYQVFFRVQSSQPLSPQPSFLALLMIVTATAVLSAIPITINGLGVREQLHVLLLAPVGVSKEAAVGVSLLLFGHLLLISLAGGILWWRVPREWS